MTPRSRFITAAGIVVAAITGLIIWSLSGTTAYYKTPSELASGATVQHQRLRVAGTVVNSSVTRDGSVTRFAVTDGKAEIAVSTQDVLPDTFGAGVEVVAEGAMTPAGVFDASSVLAKCPSKFKAKSAAAAR